MELGRDGRLYALSLKDSPRGRIIALSLSNPDLASAALVVPEGADTIEAFRSTRDRLYVDYMAGGPSELRVFALDGKPRGRVPTEPVSNVAIDGTLENGAIIVGVQSFVTPPSTWLYSPATGQLGKTALAGAWKVNFDDAEVVREWATSKDGTKIPVNIVMKKGTRRDGSNPVLLNGYGGFGLHHRPVFFLRHRGFVRPRRVHMVGQPPARGGRLRGRGPARRTGH